MEQIRALILSIRALQMETKRLFEQASKDESLSPGLIFLMLRLSQVGALNITEISEHFGITAGAATGMTDKLEKQGLVQRVRSEEDRRIVQVVLTEEGKCRLGKLRGELERLAAHAFQDVPQERLGNLVESVEEITQRLQIYLGGDKDGTP